ncbi:hypothetical protein XNA1_2110008 [Xenorhabdus nematophila str. Anatoliense]|nr:hypothetical protein XNA1_2110008 [Xenorhabdus nematophila str. Anatoliense]
MIMQNALYYIVKKTIVFLTQFKLSLYGVSFLEKMSKNL